jgi:hypothetical protein
MLTQRGVSQPMKLYHIHGLQMWREGCSVLRTK